MSHPGSSSRKLPARTSSTGWHSAGGALWTDTARGRLLPAATLTIFVRLPRRVGSTARPPFWRSRRLHPQAPLRAYRCAPPAGTCGGRSGTADISPVNSRHCARWPLPRAHVQHGVGFMQWTASIVLTPRRSQHRFHHRPLFIGQFPASCHRRCRKPQSTPRIARFRPSAIYESGSRRLSMLCDIPCAFQSSGRQLGKGGRRTRRPPA
jgi:hypothetical protein